MIIDSLTHITPNGQWFDTSHNASEDRLLQELDQAYVDQAVVVGIDGVISNEFILEVCARHPDRLIPVGSVNPASCASEREVVTMARRELLDRGFKGVKLHPRIHGYHLQNPFLDILLEEISTWEQPFAIWLCTSLYHQGVALPDSPVVSVFNLVRKYPALPFLLLHACFSEVLHLAGAIRSCQHVFIDLSYTLSHFRGSHVEQDVKFLMNTFEKRMVFGSDFPEFSPSQSLEDFNEVCTDVKPGAKARILGLNLDEILNQGNLVT